MLDRREHPHTQEVAPGLTFAVRAVELGGGAFANRYTACWQAPARAALRVVDPLESPFARAGALASRGERGLVATGGFFFLADDAATRPRARSLNLAIQDGRVLSMPVVGQDALVCRGGDLSVRHVAAKFPL